MFSRTTFRVLMFLIMVYCFALLPGEISAQSENLIKNPSLETISDSGEPLSWYRGGWGTNLGEYIYPVAGHDDGRAAQVRISSIISGDKKWAFEHVSVTPGKTYVFSDYYKSNVNSELTIEYLLNDGTYFYQWIGELPPATDWQKYSTEIQVVEDAVSMTVFHLIYTSGTLTVDDFSLHEATQSSPKPSIEFIEPVDNSIASGTIEALVEVKDVLSASVQFMLDGQLLGGPDLSAPYSVTLNTNKEDNGKHILGATLYYGEGESLDAEPIQIVIDNVDIVPLEPSIKITQPLNNAELSEVVQIVAVVNNIDAASVQFTLDDNTLGEPDTIEPFTTSLNTSSVADGRHSLGAILYYGGEKILNADPVIVNVDNQNLPPTNNLIINPGLEKSDSDAVPAAWHKGGWGDNVIEYVYPVPGHNSDKAAEVGISSYESGDAKWFFEEVPVSPGAAMTFGDYYKSDIDSYITSRYLLNDGSYHYKYVDRLSASSDWRKFSTCMFVPENAVSMTVFHMINNVGSLTVDDYSLSKDCAGTFDEAMLTISFDDSSASQYENAFPVLQKNDLKATFYAVTGDVLDEYNDYAFHKEALLELQAAGNEIGAHSVTHPYLTQLSQNEANSEINGSRTDLLKIGVSPATTFAYPYGDYNENIMQSVVDSGFTSARGISQGFNTKQSDPYKLMTMHVGSDVTPAQVNEWITQAQSNNTWLILMFHEVVENGDVYSTTPQSFDTMMNNIVDSGIRVVTIGEGVKMMTK